MTERDGAQPEMLDVIVDRWSSRSFVESAVPQSDLDLILEAAGWAPSAFNLQPWRFLYAHRGDENSERFLSLLVDFNRTWAKDASVLVFVVSDILQRKEDGTASPNHSHSFDAEAAWVLAALQATAMGYHAHAMSGVKFDEAKRELRILDDHRVEAAFVIGRQGPKEKLPEALQQREQPSGRKPVSEFAWAGNFR
ncbi:MAG: nitroreductase family protein [Alphaproteobacteria bacterium]|nr:nitroreductase family protein [Alphaproteobacteria bacterium]